WNLITNAAKYGAKAEPIAVHLEGSEGGVRLSVRNGGSKIPIEEQAELFEPLRRASAQDSASSSSLGLGLFIVRQVAIAHGGEVELRSDEGLTEFAVVLQREPGDLSS
ncbi:MAG: ATP-binding protein, partial [Alphaproteobacteria bacterium]